MRTIKLALLAGLLSVGCGSVEDAATQTTETEAQTTESGADGGSSAGGDTTGGDHYQTNVIHKVHLSPSRGAVAVIEPG